MQSIKTCWPEAHSKPCSLGVHERGGVAQVLPEVVKMLRRLKEQEEATKEGKDEDESEEEDSSDAATGDMGSNSTHLILSSGCDVP